MVETLNNEANLPGIDNLSIRYIPMVCYIFQCLHIFFYALIVQGEGREVPAACGVTPEAEPLKSYTHFFGEITLTISVRPFFAVAKGLTPRFP